MKKVLVINASSRKERSLSRRLTGLFVDLWKEKNIDDEICHREIGQGNIPHVSETWISAAFKPKDLRSEEEIQELKISDALVGELKQSDIIVLGTPMYNWSIPSSLKAYVDQIVRVNETVTVNKGDTEKPYNGLLKGKKVYLLLVRGNEGYEKGENFAFMNFQSEYLKTVFNILGIEEVEEFVLNGSSYGSEVLNNALQTATEKIKNSISKL